jgi:hypothetical protein
VSPGAKNVGVVVGVGLLAGLIRALGLVVVGGEGLGPDAPGALAAVTLGGHPYPLHPLLIGALGGAGRLSVVSGAVMAAAMAFAAPRLGGSALGVGLAVACAPLLVEIGALSGGDAPALALAAVGWAVTLGGRRLVGGLLAGLSLGVKPTALALWPVVAVAGGLPGVVGLALGAAPFAEALRPLVTPRPGGGLLGSWWRSSGGAPPRPDQLGELLSQGVNALVGLPGWTFVWPTLTLAVLGVCWPGDDRRRRVITCLVGLASLAGVSLLLGDQLRARYLVAPVLALVALSGRLVWVHALGLGLAAAALSQLGAVRAAEEGRAPARFVPWPDTQAEARFVDYGLCGADELGAMAAELAETLPLGSSLAVLRLRDGREGELLWPLMALRPDLNVERVHGGCCPGPVETCAAALMLRPVPIIFPARPERCLTPVVDPNERALAASLAALYDGVGVYGRWPGRPGADTWRCGRP